jgi:hypothetical protein
MNFPSWFAPLSRASLIRAALPTFLLCLSGCGSEKAVDITLITEPREGQEITDNRVELVEGHAVGVRVVALQDGEVRQGWSIDVSAENTAVMGVRPGVEDDVFVLTGTAEGVTQLHFVLDRRHDVFVDARVVARDDWEPTVAPLNLGGAGGN